MQKRNRVIAAMALEQADDTGVDSAERSGGRPLLAVRTSSVSAIARIPTAAVLKSCR
jgi:hypothetical protein